MIAALGEVLRDSRVEQEEEEKLQNKGGCRNGSDDGIKRLIEPRFQEALINSVSGLGLVEVTGCTWQGNGPATCAAESICSVLKLGPCLC